MKKNIINLVIPVLSFFAFSTYNQDRIPVSSLIKIIENQRNQKEVLFKKNPDIYIPFGKELREIENEKYLAGINDCKHKSIKYHKILEKNGEISYIVVERVHYNEDAHMEVCVLNKETGKWYKIDPTDKKRQDGLLLESYPDYIIGVFNEKATINDIKNKRNVLKQFPDNNKKYLELIKSKND